jgi:hypothetical protein
MEFGTGAAGAGLAAKYGWFAKLAVVFGASAAGAALISAYTPKSRKDWWWHGLGAGFGGLLFGGLVLRAASYYFEWLRPPANHAELWDWLMTVVSPLLFLFGALFWGFVGMLRDLRERIEKKGADAVASKVGL